jgi:hypothetical protein
MKEWKPITLTGRLTKKPTTISSRTGCRTTFLWTYIRLENGEQHSLSIKMGEPFFDALHNCKKGQIVTVYCLGNGRGLKNVSAFEAAECTHMHA